MRNRRKNAHPVRVGTGPRRFPYRTVRSLFIPRRDEFARRGERVCRRVEASVILAWKMYPLGRESTSVMPDLVRQEIATSAHTIVVKIGTRPLTQADGQLDQLRVAELAGELSALMEQDRRVVLVSSGAVAAGMGQLGLSRRPSDLAQLQAVAAVGQSVLVQSYDRTLRSHGRHAAQILLTAEDLDHRARYLNVRNTLSALLEMGAVPIINENDTVSVEELQTTFGDNDRLAAIVTNLVRAPLLVILSDVEGLYDGDPKDAASRIVPTVSRLDDSIFALARDASSGLTKGGMTSKLEAARIATAAGENVIIAGGRESGVLARIPLWRNRGHVVSRAGPGCRGPQTLDRIRRQPKGASRSGRRRPGGRRAAGT